MKKIELEQWEPFPGDPRRMQYAGQRIAQEVFEELKHRLEGMGYLPDEYFLMDREWENGRKIPKDADIFCAADYGGSEGTYLDVYLKWYEDSRPVTKSFITGKTLGETGADLDRMFLISSAITKAFHQRLDDGALLRRIQVDDHALRLRPLTLTEMSGIGFAVCSTTFLMTFRIKNTRRNIP